MQASIIQISVIIFVQCFSVILQGLYLFPFSLATSLLADHGKAYKKIWIDLWSQRLEKMESDNDTSAKEIVKNVF